MPVCPVTSATHWYDTFPTPMCCGHLDATRRVLIRRFSGIDGKIDQPALHDDVLAMHLGGPKRVTRWHGRRSDVRDVEVGSLTLMPAFQAYRWDTQGPIDFAHVTLSHGLLNQVAMDEFDRDPSDLRLRDGIGIHAPLIEHIFRALLVDVERPQPGRLYRDGLLIALSYNLLKDQSSLGAATTLRSPGDRPRGTTRGGLAGWQLRRVIDYMTERLAEDISLSDLIILTSLSRAQFFRSFKQSTGVSPHLYLTDLRVSQAKRLLEKSDLPIGEVSRAVGLGPSHLCTAFKHRGGLSPRSFRQSLTSIS